MLAAHNISTCGLLISLITVSNGNRLAVSALASTWCHADMYKFTDDILVYRLYLFCSAQVFMWINSLHSNIS